MKRKPAYVVLSLIELKAIVATMENKGVTRSSQCVVLRGTGLDREGKVQLRWDGDAEIPSLPECGSFRVSLQFPF